MEDCTATKYKPRYSAPPAFPCFRDRHIYHGRHSAPPIHANCPSLSDRAYSIHWSEGAWEELDDLILDIRAVFHAEQVDTHDMNLACEILIEREERLPLLHLLRLIMFTDPTDLAKARAERNMDRVDNSEAHMRNFIDEPVCEWPDTVEITNDRGRSPEETDVQSEEAVNQVEQTETSGEGHHSDLDRSSVSSRSWSRITRRWGRVGHGVRSVFGGGGRRSSFPSDSTIGKIRLSTSSSAQREAAGITLDIESQVSHSTSNLSGSTHERRTDSKRLSFLRRITSAVGITRLKRRFRQSVVSRSQRG